jgi:BirA family biotin operon repressor/biotin-[acetyl-CoA-carboxylase] ligase
VPRLDLKWPNDVLLSGKKTAGILLETVVAQDGSRAAVVGIGINVKLGSVPEELRDRATCVSQEAGTGIPRRRLLVRFLYYFQLFYCCFERGEHGELLSRWMERSSMWNGAPIWIDDGGRPRSAVTCGLTELGALRIRNDDGTEETLLAGDVSVRRG